MNLFTLLYCSNESGRVFYKIPSYSPSPLPIPPADRCMCCNPIVCTHTHTHGSDITNLFLLCKPVRLCTLFIRLDRPGFRCLLTFYFVLTVCLRQLRLFIRARTHTKTNIPSVVLYSAPSTYPPILFVRSCALPNIHLST